MNRHGRKWLTILVSTVSVLGLANFALAKTTLRYIEFAPCSTGHAFIWTTTDDQTGYLIESRIICEEYVA